MDRECKSVGRASSKDFFTVFWGDPFFKKMICMHLVVPKCQRNDMCASRYLTYLFPNRAGSRDCYVGEVNDGGGFLHDTLPATSVANVVT